MYNFLTSIETSFYVSHSYTFQINIGMKEYFVVCNARFL
jgi:hypothetical protein